MTKGERNPMQARCITYEGEKSPSKHCILQGEEKNGEKYQNGEKSYAMQGLHIKTGRKGQAPRRRNMKTIGKGKMR